MVNEKKLRLIELTSGFCKVFLDDEYNQLCEKMINKMARKRNVPFLSGRLNIWASAIIHALGTINFLFDKNFEPYVSVSDICNYFNTSKSTTGQKSKKIRDMLKLEYYDPEFSTEYMAENNPFFDFVSVEDLLALIKRPGKQGR
jgi:hypothetical protein